MKLHRPPLKIVGRDPKQIGQRLVDQNDTSLRVQQHQAAGERIQGFSSPVAVLLGTLAFAVTGKSTTGALWLLRVFALAAFGLSAWLAWLDYVLLPMLVAFIALTLFALLRIWRQSNQGQRDA